MAEARARGEWQHTASLLALLANCHRDPKKTDAFKPADFDPFAKSAKPAEPIKADISVLKDIFIDNRLPKETRS